MSGVILYIDGALGPGENLVEEAGRVGITKTLRVFEQGGVEYKVG